MNTETMTRDELVERIATLERGAREAVAKKRYNGHANYETWVVSMYVDGNYDGEGTYAHWQERAIQACNDATSDGTLDRDEAIGELSTTLREEMNELAPDLACSPFADLLNGAMSEVSWYDVAEGLIDVAIESDYFTCIACDGLHSNDDATEHNKCLASQCDTSMYYVSIRVNVDSETPGHVTDDEEIDHGRHQPDYFQGCGVCGTPFAHVATGAGNDYDEARDDALEQLATMGIDVSSIE